MKICFHNILYWIMAAKGWIKTYSQVPFTHWNKCNIVDLTAAKLSNGERDKTVRMHIGGKTVAERNRLINSVRIVGAKIDFPRYFRGLFVQKKLVISCMFIWLQTTTNYQRCSRCEL